MMPDQIRGGLSHGAAVQGGGAMDVPAPAAREGAFGFTFLDPVDITFGYGVLAGEERFGGGLSCHDAGIWGQMGVDRRQQAVRVPGLLHSNQHALGGRMDTCIRPSRALGHGRVGVNGAKGLPEFPLNAPQARLDLPAEKIRSQVGNAQKVRIGHATSVGPGTGLPLEKAERGAGRGS